MNQQYTHQTLAQRSLQRFLEDCSILKVSIPESTKQTLIQLFFQEKDAPQVLSTSKHQDLSSKSDKIVQKYVGMTEEQCNPHSRADFGQITERLEALESYEDNFYKAILLVREMRDILK